MEWGIVIMIVAGILGGMVNLALNESSRQDWFWTIIVSTGAALLIPVFLRTISSQLLSGILVVPDPADQAATAALYENRLVFFGFCLLAALSSRAFIQGLTEKVLSNLKKSQEGLQERQNELEGKVNQTDERAKELETKTAENSLIVETAAEAIGLKSGRAPVHRAKQLTPIEKGNVPDDPWKGAFGGNNEANGRRLEATVTPMTTKKGWCSVTLRVVSVDPERPLSGAVRFFLHPTFKNDQIVVKVDEEKQVAELTLAAWGAFTVGALADNDETKLELDLADDPQAPKWFRES
jgi:hypothetical protein